MHLFSENIASSSECIFVASTTCRIVATMQLNILLDNRLQIKKLRKSHTHTHTQVHECLPSKYLRCYALQLSRLYIFQ